jgi:hypothetical protein
MKRAQVADNGFVTELRMAVQALAVSEEDRRIALAPKRSFGSRFVSDLPAKR